MTIVVRAYANADDVLIAWEPDVWSADWIGFQIERRNDTNKQITMLTNRIPPKPGQAPVENSGVSSAQSPIRRCIWTDHSAVATNTVSYRVTAMKNASGGTFKADASSASSWTEPLVIAGDAGQGLQAYFNRGTLMSQVVSRFVKGDVTAASLRKFLAGLATAGNTARQYLSGDARSQVLAFLRDADRRGSTIYLAIYEFNDHELVDALKPFGKRGHLLLGNGGSTEPFVAKELTDAGLDVRHRDLSHGHGSSPSVHNKFAVECDSNGTHASRVLTGSTNWTWTGLCTQLNNVLIVDNAAIAARFRSQWDALVAAKDDMPDSLKKANGVPTHNGPLTLYFAATEKQAEFKPVLDLIAGAKNGLLFLMFEPGQSPLLSALLDRVKQNTIYVRGAVSMVKPSDQAGTITKVGGEVIKSGAPAQSFHDDVPVPAGISAKDEPSWAEMEFNVSEMRQASLIAIIHSKVIVVDPFSDDCAVITGSHNFSASASAKNDENLVIIRGNKKLAQAYALHINGVYDHYSWRAYLGSGGDPDQIYKPLTGWQKGGSRAQELAFWMNDPLAPQRDSSRQKGTAKKTPKGSKSAKKKPAKPAPKKAAKKVAKKVAKRVSPRKR